MKLNDTKCKNAKPFDPPSKSPKKIADGAGLYLWVMPNGSKYWRYRYRFHGIQKEVYPEVSLKEARVERDVARKMVSEGKDPSKEKKCKKLLSRQNSENTFEVIAREWYANRRLLETKTRPGSDY